MRRLLPLLALLALVGAVTPAAAVQLYVATDTPVDVAPLGTLLPWNVARLDTTAGTYSPAFALPFGAGIDGLHRLDAGDWLVSFESPTDLGGTTWMPQDVLRTNGVGAAAFFCGQALGILDGTSVDAIFTVGGDAGPLVLSFDRQVTFGATTYQPADLLLFNRFGPLCTDWIFGGAWFDSTLSIPPVPVTTNVVGADERMGLLILSFDVPTTLGAVTYLPGELVSWSGAAFASYYLNAAWSTGAASGDFAFLADPGRVPVTMTAIRLVPSGAIITLNWAASCSAGAEDYAIYEGTIGAWYSHVPVVCTDAGAPLTETIGTAPGNRYYLVVPHNLNDEGSYGIDSFFVERPQLAGSCPLPQSLTPCP